MWWGTGSVKPGIKILNVADTTDKARPFSPAKDGKCMSGKYPISRPLNPIFEWETHRRTIGIHEVPNRPVGQEIVKSRILPVQANGW